MIQHKMFQELKEHSSDVWRLKIQNERSRNNLIYVYVSLLTQTFNIHAQPVFISQFSMIFKHIN